MRKTKIIKLICSAFTFSFLIQGGIIYASSTLGTADGLDADSVIGAKGEKSMSKNVKYSIQSTTKEIEYMCYPFGGTYSVKPTVNEEYNIKCAVVSKDGGIAVPPFKTFSNTPDQGGNRSGNYHGVILHWHPTRTGGYYAPTDYFDLSLNVNVYQGSTNMGGDQFGWDSNSNYEFNKQDIEGNLGDINFGNGSMFNGGKSIEDFYSSNPYGENNGTFNQAITDWSNNHIGNNSDVYNSDNTYNTGNNTRSSDGNGTFNGRYDFDEKTTIDYDYGNSENGNYSNNVDPSNHNGRNDGIGNSGIGGVMNDALSDSSKSFNSGQNDWQSSANGSNGDANLDNYFSGAGNGTSADSLGNGLTGDLFGFGQNDFSVEDKDKLKEGGYYDANGNYINTNVNGKTYLDTMYDENGNYIGGETNSNNDYHNGDTLENFLSKFGNIMDSTQDFLGFHSDGDGNFSLMDTLKSVGDSLFEAPSAMTDQEMFNMIKKLLLESGYSIDDLLNGKNYDANSAYTEPNSSWDMNRITTLLSNKKVKLEPEEVKAAKEKLNQKSSLTNASVSSLPFK